MIVNSVAYMAIDTFFFISAFLFTLCICIITLLFAIYLKVKESNEIKMLNSIRKMLRVKFVVTIIFILSIVMEIAMRLMS